MDNKENTIKENAKTKQLKQYHRQNNNHDLTSDYGVKISNDQRSLRAGRRGPTLLQDPRFYKKQSRFSRERIPEKVVHARGFGVHGVFESTKSMKEYTKADFLKEPGIETPVFVRFSNFIGNRGSKDTAIDVRGFATKFYTQEGNYDNLALSFAVFAIQDAMKFSDFTHAVKQNPVTDVPQATIAHDNPWDYISNNQEIAHFIMWLMSSRGRPRSWRMMEGYPINTFRFINDEGKSTFVRFVWKPTLGVHSLLIEEANIIGGVDPDYHRHDMIEAIKRGAYPEYELGVQMIAEEDEFKYDFDVLDDTKLWPEEIIPFEIIGKMTLNKLVDNAFAEEEQSSFDPSNLVPGIEFSNDPVLQGRSFAYRDTDYHRLGTANIEEIPINQPIVPTHYNDRDGYVKHRIDVDKIHYHNNSLANNTPSESSPDDGGYMNYPGKVEGNITRDFPSDAFDDHFSQARLFWNSMSPVEKEHIIETFSFHLGKVLDKSVRQQSIDMFANVDKEMASRIALDIGVNPPSISHVPNENSSPVLSMANTIYSPKTRKVAVIIGNEFDDKEVESVLNMLDKHQVFYEIISDKLGPVTGIGGSSLQVNKTFITVHPVLYDSIYIVGGNSNNQTKFDKCLMDFVNMSYKHYKAIGVASGASAYIECFENLSGIVTARDSSDFENEFIKAISQNRFWDRM